MTALPTGRIAFLFTDIEGSTRLVQRLGARYDDLLDRHHTVLRAAIAGHRGHEIRTDGDAFFAVFEDVGDAVAAAAASQRAIADDDLLSSEDLRVRMGVHVGDARLGGDNYVGIDVHIAARVADAANGGQIIITDEAREESNVSGRPLGSFWLKDIDDPVALWLVEIEGDDDRRPPRAAPSHPSHAPVDLSSFIGRDEEIATGLALLGAHRMVTLIGPGGTGKTRLSVEIASRASRTFRDGAWFVALAGTTDPDSVPHAILDALDAPEADGSPAAIDSVCAHLRDRSTLLIVDNCEQVLAAAPSLQRILEASAGTRILATSRAPLGIRGEQELAVTPLDPGSDGVALFADRARAVKSGFRVDDTNRSDVRAIVDRLDGLPLAIELAAARIRMMSPASIVTTLDPLALARTGSSRRDGETTLHDTIRWSFDLLTAPEQQLIVRLGVFPTGADLDRIISVAQPSQDLDLDPIGGLSGLVEHSLLVADESTGNLRFRMLETIREFASRLLAESQDSERIRARHTAAYCALIEEAEPHLVGPDSHAWMIRLGVENANLQTAFAHAIEVQDAESAQRIVAAAWRFWQVRGHLGEAMRAAESALEIDGAPDHVRARALDAAGSIAYWTGDADATLSYYEDAVAFRRSRDITDGLAEALFNLSFPVADVRGRDAATDLLTEADERFSSSGDKRGQSQVRVALARSWIADDPQRAARYAEEAAVGYEAIGDHIWAAWARSLGAAAIHAYGDHATSMTVLQDALAVFAEIGDLSGIAVTSAGIADNARRLGDPETALYLVGAIHALQDETGIGVRTVIDRTVVEFSDPAAVAALEPELADAYTRGRDAARDAWIDRALCWTDD